MSLIDQTVSSQTRSLWHQLEQANMRLLGVQKEARPLVLHLLVKQIERKDVSCSTQPSPIAVCS